MLDAGWLQLGLIVLMICLYFYFFIKHQTNRIVFFFHQQFVDIGYVTSIESNHKQIESARKGQEICIKIEPIPGEAPKMFGRHFEAEDMLVSKVGIHFFFIFSKYCNTGCSRKVVLSVENLFKYFY